MRSLLRGVVVAWLGLHALAASVAAQEGASKYARVVDDEPSKRLSLEISSRAFRSPKEHGPTVHLVGAIHIGDEAYYRELQTFLDGQGLVLFEGVKPAGTGASDQPADDAAKAALTTSRQRLLAVLIERHRAKHGEYPATLEAMRAELLGSAARIAAAAINDGWGRAQAYRVEGSPITSFDVVSLGADGAEGGEGPAADLRFSAQKPLSRKEKAASGQGIQSQLAAALGLRFQLEAIDYARPAWRNSDMSIDQVQARLAASGATADALFSMLDGTSLASRFVSVLLGFVKASPPMAMSVKVMLVETLANSDEMLGSQAKAAGLDAMMKVIVVDRNAEVFKDLRAVLEREPEVKSIAIFYGAGHLPDMERRLTEEMGFTFDHDRWFRAIDIDLASQPGAAAQAKSMRATMQRMLEQRRKAAEPE